MTARRRVLAALAACAGILAVSAAAPARANWIAGSTGSW